MSFKDETLALKMLEGKFDASHVVDFRTRVKSAFKYDLTVVSFWT